MKKNLMVIVMAMVMATSVVACSNNQSQNSTKTTEESKTNEENKSTEENQSTEKPEKPAADVAKQLAESICKALGENNGFDVDVASDEMFTVGLYDLDLSKVNEVIAKQNSISSVNPDTLVIVDCKDGYADTVLGFLKEAYDNAKSYQELYPYSVEKVNGTRIYQEGNLVIYVIAGGYTPEENVEEFVNAEYEKVDEAIKSILGELPKNLAE